MLIMWKRESISHDDPISYDTRMVNRMIIVPFLWGSWWRENGKNQLEGARVAAGEAHHVRLAREIWREICTAGEATRNFE